MPAVKDGIPTHRVVSRSLAPTRAGSSRIPAPPALPGLVGQGAEDAELVALRDRPAPPRTRRPARRRPAARQSGQPFDLIVLGILTVGPQVQVQAILDLLAFRYAQEQQARSTAILRCDQHLVRVVVIGDGVVEGRRPKRASAVGSAQSIRASRRTIPSSDLLSVPLKDGTLDARDLPPGKSLWTSSVGARDVRSARVETGGGHGPASGYRSVS